jgi:hypothetical protein
VGGLFQAFEIVIGAAGLRFLGSRLLVLELLELRDIVEQVRQVGVIGADELGLVGDVSRNRRPAAEQADTGRHQQACSPPTRRH